MLNSLQPVYASSDGKSYGRPPFAAGQRLFVLISAGLVFVPLMFISKTFGWGLVAWNLALCILYFADLRSLPFPAKLTVERSFEGVLSQLQESTITLMISNASAKTLHLCVVDDIPQSLSFLPPQCRISVMAKNSVAAKYEILPTARGDCKFGIVHLRYESNLRLAQAWAIFDVTQRVRIYPSLKDRQRREEVLLRSRQIELQLRTATQRGQGREFESLREFQTGDDRRNVCWTATARRGRLVTILRQSERSQTIWAAVDCGRLMRARLERRSKLDYGTEAVMRLAELANYGGDSIGMLAYGLKIQHRLLPGKGSKHLHAILNQLALVREENSEADHLRAVAALLSLQKQRAMMVWITDIADMAITPEVVVAALQASRRHLVVVAVLGQPDVNRLATTAPTSKDQVYLYAAATETIRRRELMLSHLRRGGVHVIEVNAPQLTGAVLNKYLEVKQKNLL
jgi:uncharacterized protein (DUF58 family)